MHTKDVENLKSLIANESIDKNVKKYLADLANIYIKEDFDEEEIIVEDNMDCKWWLTREDIWKARLSKDKQFGEIQLPDPSEDETDFWIQISIDDFNKIQEFIKEKPEYVNI